MFHTSNMAAQRQDGKYSGVAEIQSTDAEQDDVFVNGGEAEESSMDSGVHQSGELLDVPGTHTPRRGSGSIMKDETRSKPSQKKTVSFSSMPTERKISKGRKSWL